MFHLLKKCLLEYDPHYVCNSDVTNICFIQSTINEKEKSTRYEYSCRICGVSSTIVMEEFATEGGSGFSIHSFPSVASGEGADTDDIWNHLAYGDAWMLHDRLKALAKNVSMDV